MDVRPWKIGQIRLIGMTTWFEETLVTRPGGPTTVFGRPTLLNAQTGQCTPLDDPTWVPIVACGLARMAYAYVPSSAGGDSDAGKAAEVLQRR